MSDKPSARPISSSRLNFVTVSGATGIVVIPRVAATGDDGNAVDASWPRRGFSCPRSVSPAFGLRITC
jgi:hypothetical protein